MPPPIPLLGAAVNLPDFFSPRRVVAIMAGVVSAPGWHPDPAGLRNIAGMLHESMAGSNASQSNVYKQLEAFSTHSDFNNYLAFILAHAVPHVSSELNATSGASSPDQNGQVGGSNGGYLDRGNGVVASAVDNNAQASAGNAISTGANGASAPVLSENVRQAAGLLLKNNLNKFYKSLPHEIQAYINSQLLSAIVDPSKLVRSVGATCIAAIVSRAGLQVCSDLFPTLVTYLDSNQDVRLDGALDALSRICEDAPDLLEEDPSQPLGVLIPKLLKFFYHPNENFRMKVIHIVNQFLLVMPPALVQNLDSFLSALFRVADDTSPEVRKLFCSAICMLLEAKPDALAPQLASIVEYMIRALSDSSEEVALEACEFWCAYAETVSISENQSKVLPVLVPKLLDSMVFTGSDMVAIAAEIEEDDMIADRPEDSRPRFHQPRLVGSSASSASSASAAPELPRQSSASKELQNFSNSAESLQSRSASVAISCGAQSTNGPGDNLGVGVEGQDEKIDATLTENERSFTQTGSTSAVWSSSMDAKPHAEMNVSNYADEKLSEDDEDSNDNEYTEEWTVRRCSAAALDSLACKYGNEVLSVMLPVLQERLVDPERWERREAGILALGAVAEGCYAGVLPHMQQLFPYLISCVADARHCIRIMGCWTLSRYSRWIIEEGDEVKKGQFLQVILERMLDRNKTVQKAACSALATYEEQAGSLLNPYIAPILQSIAKAFEKYQQNNLVVLLDTVCTLADAVGSELASQEHVNVLMPHLINRWNCLSDTDPALVPLFECLGYVFRSLGLMSQKFVSVIFTRCINLVESTYASEVAGKLESVHCDFLTCSLDLMCSLTEALGPSIEPCLVKGGNTSGANVLQLLFAAMKDKRQEVRQSAFALVGELARVRTPSLIPVLKEYTECVVSALNPDYMSVANNATWALGEIIMLAGFLPSGMPLDRDAIKRCLVDQALGPLVRVVSIRQLSKSLLENTAITICRMGLAMPDAVAPHLDAFAEAALSSIRNIRDDQEKEQACFGINAMIKLNPKAVLGCLAYYADAVASWLNPNPKLEADFAMILHGFKNSLGEQWDALYATFPPRLQTCLHGRFNL